MLFWGTFGTLMHKLLQLQLWNVAPKFVTKHSVGCSDVVNSHPRQFGIILLRNDGARPTNITWYETKFWILGYFGCLADMNDFFSFSVHDQSIKTNLGAMFHNWNWSSLHIKVPNIPQKQQKLSFFGKFLIVTYS